MAVPVRVDGEARGVLLLERAGTPFTAEGDAAALRVLADQVARRLDEVRRNDRWFGARWAAHWRDQAARWVGPRHTWTKVLAVAGALFLAFAVFVPLPYRVEAPFIVRADALTHLPAPFDGYLGEVLVRPGDLVKAGQPLLRLDTADLLLEAAASRAQVQVYTSEAEKAEAERHLSDMRVALAQKAQAQARLDLALYRLGRSELKAPFDGVVVEGDLRERIGAPVKTGDVLLKVSQLKGLYVEVRVPERDIDQVAASQDGEVAFASQPADAFPIKVMSIDPAATADRDGNHFVLRARLDQRADWFRPGMSGVAKVDAGHRSLLWIATHRLVDFLRMQFWW